MKISRLFVIPLTATAFLVGCKPSTHTITFDADGGSYLEFGTNTFKIQVDNNIKLVPFVRCFIPTLANNTFAYYTYGDGAPIESNDVVTKDVKISAHYFEITEPLDTLNDVDWNTIKSVAVTNPNPSSCFKIGATKTVKVNNQDHLVRIIGFNHDDLTDGSGKASITFEFVNYISDSNGYSLATPWSWKFGESSNAQDYPNSDLRKAMEGEGNGEVAWYEMGSPTKSTTYKTSLLDMLPEDLRGALKEVKKDIAVSYQFKVNSINTKLFPLSYREVTAKVTTDKIAEEGQTYQYYRENDVDATRIKHQVKWHDGAATNYTVITDVDYKSATAWNYAGFNSSYKDEYGGFCWLRSPVATEGANSAYQVGVGGGFLKYQVYMYTLAVAPAFCI